MKTKFTEPQLCHYDFDMKRDWFVYFRYVNPETGKPKLFIYKKGINYHKKRADRLREANGLLTSLSEMLNKENWNPFIKLSNTPIQNKNLVDVLKELLETKKGILKHKSYRGYSDAIAFFTSWLKSINQETMYPQNFTHILARGYLDWLLTERKYAGKSHNTQLGIMRMYFNSMLQREVIIKNPFAYIKKLPEDYGKNFAFTASEKAELKELIKECHPRLYLYIQFMYYCFIRRTELIDMKAGDINLETKTITIQSGPSKNRKQQSVIIPVSFEAVLRKMEIDKIPKNWYVFSHLLEPGEKRLYKADYITELHRRYMNVLHIGLEKTLYSWKSTGVVDLYNATQDPYLIMNQCRHSEITTTMLYLRSLGLQTNEKIRNANITF